MSAQRCPHCQASVPPGAPWCTLCYADLRPAVTVPAATATATSCEPAPLPAGERPAAPSSAAPGWPCQGCGGLAPFAAMSCPHCGAAFLPAAPGLTLPWLGDARLLSGRVKALIMLGGGVVVMAVLVLAYLVGGSLV